MKRQKGFTLIDLMIWVCIFGIILAVVVPAYKKYQEEGDQTTQSAS